VWRDVEVVGVGDMVRAAQTRIVLTSLQMVPHLFRTYSRT
jgi:hypothetical protein